MLYVFSFEVHQDKLLTNILFRSKELCYPRRKSLRYGLHGSVIGPTASVAKIASTDFSGLNLISVRYLFKDREPAIFQ